MTQLELALTVSEADLLAECEATVERGLKTFVEVGQALMSIRDNRLYRAEYPSFEAYCDGRWSLSRPRAYQLISAAAAVSTMVDTELPAPTNERQARELARVSEDDRADLWAEAFDRAGGQPTAAVIRGVREERAAIPYEGPPPVIPERPTWSMQELAMRDRVCAGETVVASMRGEHQNLIAWADDNGKFVRVDRRTVWGNPFEMPADGDRAAVVTAYALHYLPHKPSLLGRLDELRGVVLGCWCAPERCHGDVLVELLESLC